MLVGAVENNIYLVAQNQSTTISIFHSKRPFQPIQWLLPENVTGFEMSHLYMPGALWRELSPNKSYRMEKTEPDLGVCTIGVRTDDDYVEAEITIENMSGRDMREVIVDVCCGFRYSKELMNNAIEHGRVKTGGKYRRVIDTDRSSSKLGVMPNYAIDGTPLCPKWRETSSTDYGFGLSDDRAESSMVLTHTGTEREWLATFFTSANELWFNVLEPFHGCMHSNAFRSVLASGETWKLRGRIYFHEGTLDEMVEKSKRALAAMESDLK